MHPKTLIVVNGGQVTRIYTTGMPSGFSQEFNVKANGLVQSGLDVVDVAGDFFTCLCACDTGHPNYEKIASMTAVQARAMKLFNYRNDVDKPGELADIIRSVTSTFGAAEGKADAGVESTPAENPENVEMISLDPLAVA